MNLYSAEQESASDMAERSAQFSAFASSLPFNATMKSNPDYQYSVLNDDPMRRSTNSVSSEISQSHDFGNNKTDPSGKIGLPTIVENQPSKDSKAIEQELDDKNQRAERSK